MSTHPVVITTINSKANVLRAIALEMALRYEEVCAENQDGKIKFIFPDLDERQTRALIERVPREVYAYNAEFR